ncbi:hypothetical protein [Paenibacillus yanchengensis]|uniref:Uncharacterized protein n=1 Tax=Paenibacillus yanchengensis TaxID=2035833 RepID=A0ABW4YM60_9BACL
MQYNTEVTIRVTEPVKQVYLAPQQMELAFTEQDGAITYTIPSWNCHQMVVITY